MSAPMMLETGAPSPVLDLVGVVTHELLTELDMRVRHQKVVNVQGDDEDGTSGSASDLEVANEDEDLGVGITRDGAVADKPVVKFLAPLVAGWDPAVEGPIPSHDHVT